jgi:hypothetical protein
VIWNVQAIQGDGFPSPLSLYYTRSVDGGHTFSAAKLAVEEPVAWREIMTDSKGNLHLLWQPQDTLTTVWDQVSLDGGDTWQYPHGLPAEGMHATVTRDPAGRLHVLSVGQGVLHHWLWDGSDWQSETSLGWPSTSQDKNPIRSLTATVNNQGRMMVALAAATDEGDVANRTLLYSARMLKLPSIPTTIQDAPPQTELPPTSAPITPTSDVSLAATGTAESEPVSSRIQTDINETGTGISPFTIALFPVVLLLLGVLGIFIRQVVQSKDR